MSDRVFAAYVNNDSILNRLDPRFKLVFSIVLMVLILKIESVLALATYALLVLMLIILADLNLKKVTTSIKSMFFIALLAFILNLFITPGEEIFSFYFLSITKEGLYLAILVSIRIALLSLESSVLLSFTTSPLELAKATESLLSPLKLFKLPVRDFALMLSIALRFIPTLEIEARKLMKAQTARGANLDIASFKEKLKYYPSVIVPLLVSSFKRADDLATALEARAYNSFKPRSSYRPLSLKKLDYFYIFIAIVFIIFIYVFEVIV